MSLFVIVFLALLWFILLITDSVCPLYLNKKPIFATLDYNIAQKDGGSGSYKGIGYSIEIRGHLSTDNHKSELFQITDTKIRIFNIVIYKHHSNESH